METQIQIEPGPTPIPGVYSITFNILLGYIRDRITVLRFDSSISSDCFYCENYWNECQSIKYHEANGTGNKAVGRPELFTDMICYRISQLPTSEKEAGRLKRLKIAKSQEIFEILNRFFS